MTYERDVIIVGAGIAGSVCAAYLARAGADVLLLDKAVYPRDKCCGDILREETVTHLSRLKLFDDLDRNGTLLRRIHVISQNGSECVLPFEAYASPRFYVDNLIADKAVSLGAEFRDGCNVRELIIEDGYVKGVRVRERGEDYDIRCRLIILADGSCELAPGERRDAGALAGAGRYIGERAYFAGINLEETLAKDQYNAYGVFGFHESLPNGYYWVVPSGAKGVRDGYCNVGIIRDAEAAENIRARDVFAELIEKNRRMSALFVGARQVSPWKKDVMNDVTSTDARSGNGYLVIGNSGSTMLPLLKDGTGAAAGNGEAAAMAAKEAISANDFSAEFLAAEYDRRVEADRDRLKYERITSESLYDVSVSNQMVARMVNNPNYTKKIVKEVFG